MLNSYISVLQLIVLVNIWDGQATAAVHVHLCCLVLHICINLTLHVFTHTHNYRMIQICPYTKQKYCNKCVNYNTNIVTTLNKY